MKMLKNALLRYDLRRVKSISRYLILAFALAIVFLYPNYTARVYAAQSESQLVDDTQSQAPQDSYGFNQSLDITEVWVAATTTIEIDVQNLSATPDIISFKWWWNDYANTYQCSDYYQFTATSSARQKVLITTTQPCIQAMIDAGFNNTTTTRGFALTGVAANTRMWGSSNPDAYPYGVFYNNGLAANPDANVKDAYFVIATLPAVNQIQIDFPVNASSTPEFEVFLVSGNNIESAEDYRMLARVSFGTSSSSLNFCPGNFLSNENPELGPFESHIYNWFVEQPLITYYAQASLLYCPLTDPLECAFDPNLSCDNLGSYEIKATSTLISYFITGEEGIVGGGLPMPTSTATSSEWVITCDPTDNLFQRSLCYLFQALFSPKQSDLNQFDNLRVDLINKAPFGYFVAIKNALSGLAATSSLAFDLSASTGVLAPILTPFRTGLIFILWLGFGFWLFNRIKHLDL